MNYHQCELTIVSSPHMLTTKQQRDPFGPQQQNTTLAVISAPLMTAHSLKERNN